MCAKLKAICGKSIQGPDKITPAIEFKQETFFANEEPMERYREEPFRDSEEAYFSSSPPNNSHRGGHGGRGGRGSQQGRGGGRNRPSRSFHGHRQQHSRQTSPHNRQQAHHQQMIPYQNSRERLNPLDRNGNITC